VAPTPNPAHRAARVIVSLVTWLPVDVSAARERDAVLALQPEAAEWWLSVLEQSWQIADPDLLELCSSALAQLLDCRAELERDEGDALDILDSGRESRASEEAARAFVAYAGQFAGDQNGLAGYSEHDV